MKKVYRERVLMWIGYMATSMSKRSNAIFGPLLNLVHCGRWAGPFGHPGEPMSSVIGKIRRANGGQVPRKYFIMRAVDWFLELIDKDHTLEAIKDDRSPQWPKDES